MHLRHLPSIIAFLSLFVAASCSNKAETITPKEALSSPPAYDYPINNPYAATVIGVPPEMRVDFSSLPLPTDKTIVLFKHRYIPEGFWYNHGLHYSELLQSKPAPLVYIIAGTGGDNHGASMVKIANVLYSAGFSVVMLPSPTHPNFIINASSNYIPGRPSQDGEDMYQVMERINPEVSKEAQVTSRMLLGYSLGAMDVLYVTKCDDEKKQLNFSKILLINPPLNLYNSMKILDNMLYRGMPGGINDADGFIKNTVQRLSTVQQTGDALDFANEQLLLQAYSEYKLGDNRLATIIGMSFRLAAANMIFTADVMGHYGYIFPKNEEFKTTTHLNDYMAVALRTKFQDYFDEIYTEKYMAGDTTLSTQKLVSEGNLETFRDLIAHHPNMAMLTNADDVILAPGEYNTLVGLFGKNAITFPNGGHMGNLAHPAVSYRIVQFLNQRP